MRALILWADQRSANLGVRALADGTAALTRTVWPEAEIALQNFGRGSAPMPVQGLRSLVKERVTGRAGLLPWLASFDLVLDTRSGDSFADIYGRPRLTTMSALAELAVQAGTPVVMTPQTIGPFDSVRGRATGRFSMRRARLVMARDTVSAQHATRLGRPVDVVSTDVVFALPVPDVPKTRDVLLNISGLLWQGGPHVDATAYRRAVTDLYRGLVADGRHVELLAHVLPSASPDNDVPALEEFARTVAPDVAVHVPADLEAVRELVTSARLVVGSRMHACLNALSVGTPAVPLAYSRKFAPLLSDLGWTTTIDLRTHEDPAGAARRAAGQDRLAGAVTEVQERARELLAAAGDALRGAR